MIVFLGNSGKLPIGTSPVLAGFYLVAMLLLFIPGWLLFWTIIWFFLWFTPLATPDPESWQVGFWIFTAISAAFMFIIYKTTDGVNYVKLD